MKGSSDRPSRAENHIRWAEDSRDRLRQRVSNGTANHHDEKELLHQEEVIEYNKRLLGEQ